MTPTPTEILAARKAAEQPEPNMKTNKLVSIMNDAGIVKIRDLTVEYLADLESSGICDLAAPVGQILQKKAGAAGLPTEPAWTAWNISSDVDADGRYSDLVTLDGVTGDLIITEEKIEFVPLPGGVNWGEAM